MLCKALSNDGLDFNIREESDVGEKRGVRKGGISWDRRFSENRAEDPGDRNANEAGKSFSSSIVSELANFRGDSDALRNSSTRGGGAPPGVRGVAGADNDARVLLSPDPILRSAKVSISEALGLFVIAAGPFLCLSLKVKTAALEDDGVPLVCRSNTTPVEFVAASCGRDVSFSSGRARLDIVSGAVRRCGVRDGAGGKLSGRGVNDDSTLGLASMSAAMASISAIRAACAFPDSMTVPISDAVDMASDPTSSSITNKDVLRFGPPRAPPLVELDESSCIVGLALFERCALALASASASAARCKLAAFRVTLP